MQVQSRKNRTINKLGMHEGLLINDVITGGGGGALQQVPNVKAECHSMNQVPSLACL